MGLKPVLFYILAFVGFCVFQIDWASDLRCFHCADTGGHPECQDDQFLKKVHIKNHSRLIRNCTHGEKYCMTEKFSKQGVTYSFIRDCLKRPADGYSFNKTGRLTNLKPDNVRVCTFDMDTLGQKCLTLCESDLCNGPSGADGLILSGNQFKIILLFCFIVYSLCH